MLNILSVVFRRMYYFFVPARELSLNDNPYFRSSRFNPEAVKKIVVELREGADETTKRILNEIKNEINRYAETAKTPA